MMRLHVRLIIVCMLGCIVFMLLALGLGRGLPPEDEMVFSARFYGADYEIYRMSLGRGLTAAITHNGDDDVYPTWSPDGSQIAFVSNPEGKYRIYIMDAQGDELRRLTGSDTDEHRPAWSPDGRNIAYERLVYSFSSVLMMNDIQTGGITFLTDGDSSSSSPSWSQDGRYVVFSADPSRFGDPNLYTVDIRNGAMTRLIRRQTFATDPAWSPDGRYVAYTGDTIDPNIYLWDTQTAQAITLYEPDFSNYRLIFNTPKWSANGQFLVFATSKDGLYSAVYQLNVADCLRQPAVCTPHLLTPKLGIYINPEWRPTQP